MRSTRREEVAREHALLLTKLQQHRDSLPSPMIDLNRHQLLEISTVLLRTGFYQWCIGNIITGGCSYEDLFEEEGVGEGNGVIWFIMQKKSEPEEAINALRTEINNCTKELMALAGVSNMEDLYIVLSKIHAFNMFGFSEIGVDLSV